MPSLILVSTLSGEDHGRILLDGIRNEVGKYGHYEDREPPFVTAKKAEVSHRASPSRPKDRSLDASGPDMLQYECQAARNGLAVALDVGASQGIFRW